MDYQLLPGMQLGVASAAAQIEGDAADHNWNHWYHMGRIQDGSDPGRAAGHLKHWQEDIDLMHSMGIQVYRFSIEWARLEPSEGVWNRNAVRHYRKLIAYMKKCGIEPLMTLHHFTNPMWFERRGGFTDPHNINAFLRYVSFAVQAFGDLVSEYITINEPNVYAVNGFLGGGFPPGERSTRLTARVMSVMAACHIKSYHLIHRLRKERGLKGTQVGFAHHALGFQRNHRNPFHITCAAITGWMFQDALAHACLTGHFLPPVRNICGISRGQYADFLGLNYYACSTIDRIRNGIVPQLSVNDQGRKMYPQEMIACARALYSILRRPIYITGNGTCNQEDAFRSRYIYEHLKAASQSTLPFLRYYHWCFCDSFEWLEGESARFGLVHIDYETQKRTVKKSGRFYADMIRQGGVDRQLYNNYIANQEYH